METLETTPNELSIHFKKALCVYGCMTWAQRNAHYRKLRTTHHKLLLRVIGYHCVHDTYRRMPYAKALKKTGSQSVEATIRQRRLLFAGALARQGDKRFPKRLLFAGRLEGGEDPGLGQPAQHWHKSLRDDSKAIGALHGFTPTDRRTFGVDRLAGQRRRASGRECRGTQGFCWGRRDLWRRGTRATKMLASYAR